MRQTETTESTATSLAHMVDSIDTTVLDQIRYDAIAAGRMFFPSAEEQPC